MPIDQGPAAPYRNQRDVELENVDSVDIPPYGACEIVGSYRPETGSAFTPGAGRTVYQVVRPTEDNPCAYIINLHCWIPAGETSSYGGSGRVGTIDDPLYAILYEAPDEIGQGYGIKAGSFYLHKDYCGFVYTGDYSPADGGMARVHRFDDCDDTTIVRAIECTVIGVVAKAQPQKYNEETHEYEDDTDKDPVDVYDPNCWRVALGNVTYGDIYKVERANNNNCGRSSDFVPAMPYGLVRRVKIPEQIDCGSSGKAYLMETDADSATCEWANIQDCEVQVCNPGNRSIACDATEEATVIWHPGDCKGWLIPDPRPLRATATLAEDMCSSPAEIDPDSIIYEDVCDWRTREDVEYVNNPLTLLACENKKVELAWNDEDCGWDVVNVQPQLIGPVMLDWDCDSGNCRITKQKTASSIAVQQCESCGGTANSYVDMDTEIVLTSAQKTCTSGTPDSGGNTTLSTCDLEFFRKEICILGCKDAVSKTELTVSFTVVEVMTDASFYQSGTNLKLDKGYTDVCVLCVGNEDTETDTVVGTDCSTESGA